jgi:hypothetical protein
MRVTLALVLCAMASLSGGPANADDTQKFQPCPTRWWILVSAKDLKAALVALHSELERESAQIERVESSNLYTLTAPRGLVSGLKVQFGGGGLMVTPQLSKQCEVWDGGYAHRLDPLSNSDSAAVRGEMNKLKEQWQSTQGLSAFTFQLRSK